MAKKLELYKSKSSGEIDRKIQALDTKAKQEAKQLKSDMEQLKEMMGFKEKKIAELQKEIERLKHVIRAEADIRKAPISKPEPKTGAAKMEKKYIHIQ